MYTNLEVDTLIASFMCFETALLHQPSAGIFLGTDPIAHLRQR